MDERMYTTTKHITTLLLRSQVKTLQMLFFYKIGVVYMLCYSTYGIVAHRLSASKLASSSKITLSLLICYLLTCFTVSSKYAMYESRCIETKVCSL